MRIAGSLPFLPHRLIVSEETRRREATSRIVKRSGKSASDTLGSSVDLYDMERIIKYYFEIVKTRRFASRKLKIQIQIQSKNTKQ